MKVTAHKVPLLNAVSAMSITLCLFMASSFQSSFKALSYPLTIYLFISPILAIIAMTYGIYLMRRGTPSDIVIIGIVLNFLYLISFVALQDAIVWFLWSI